MSINPVSLTTPASSSTLTGTGANPGESDFSDLLDKALSDKSSGTGTSLLSGTHHHHGHHKQLEAAAQKLGINLDDLLAALQTSSTSINGVHKPDLAVAAKKLNISLDSLKEAMGIA